MAPTLFRVLLTCWLAFCAWGDVASAAPPPVVQGRMYVLTDPDAVMRLDRRPGQSVCFQITGATDGTVWGNDSYTADSHLPTVAVHAGVLQPGRQGLLRVTFLPGQDSYTGTTRNGVTTHPYGSYGSSYRVEGLTATGKVVPAMPDPGTAQGFEDPQPGKTYYVYLVGKSDGGIWGTDVYTSDSPLAVAAVHAGVVAVDEMAVVAVRLLAGQSSYEGSERHGIASSGYGAYQLSYSLERANP